MENDDPVKPSIGVLTNQNHLLHTVAILVAQYAPEDVRERAKECLQGVYSRKIEDVSVLQKAFFGTKNRAEFKGE